MRWRWPGSARRGGHGAPWRPDCSGTTTCRDGAGPDRPRAGCWRTIAAHKEHAAVTRPTDLPPNVRRLVDEIESEMGETDVDVDGITGSRGDQREGESHLANGR